MKTASARLLGLLMTGCQVACHTGDSTSLTSEEYNVYETYINAFPFYKNRLRADTIILADSTRSANEIDPKTPWNWVTQKLGYCCLHTNDTVCCRTVNDPEWSPLFETIKQQKKMMDRPIDFSKMRFRYPVKPLSAFKAQASGTDWGEEATSRYFFTVSRVSFNSQKTKALFFGSFVCGGKCGRGELIMLTKTAGKWKIIDTFRFWIA